MEIKVNSSIYSQISQSLHSRGLPLLLFLDSVNSPIWSYSILQVKQQKIGTLEKAILLLIFWRKHLNQRKKKGENLMQEQH